MAVITREDVAAHAAEELKRETVSVPALRGDVVLTELSLEQRLDFDKVLRGDGNAEAKPGIPPSAAKAKAAPASRRSDYALVPELLAMAVLAADDAPLFTVQQWRVFGARNKLITVQLFNAAMRLSGLGDDAEAEAKN
jgi:hypothetical protein